jgi:expansin (peptidoglycan-binding protein)
VANAGAPTVSGGLGGGNSDTYGATAAYTCNSGSTKSGANPTCAVNGTWGAAPTCTPVSCGTPPVVANAGAPTVSGGAGGGNSDTYGATATYTCNSGYTENGANPTCAANGTWGAAPTCTQSVCTWTGGPNSSNAELTCYWFGQNTATGGGCGTSYKTYCGYCSTESGSNNGGSCPTGITDSVPNMGTSYFAAFPNDSAFGQGAYCGMCVDVTWQSKTITATIVDECTTCGSTGQHIDLSLSAAVALGLGQGGNTGDATSGVTWKAVDCPVTGNIVGVYNGSASNSQQIYFQNVAFPVAAAKAGTHTATQAFGYWDFGAPVAGQTVTLTDTLGHVITGTIPSSSGGSVGAQFPLTCL